MGLSIGSMVSMGASLLPKISAPIANVVKKVGGDRFLGAAASVAQASSSGSSDPQETMKQMTTKFIFDNLQKMRDETNSKLQEAMKKGDPGAV